MKQIITLLLFISPLLISSQIISPTFGVTNSKVNFGTSKSQARTTASFGSYIDFGKTSGIRTGLFYTQRKYYIDAALLGSKVNYIDLPALFFYDLGRKGEETNIYVSPFGGVIASYLIGEKLIPGDYDALDENNENLNIFATLGFSVVIKSISFNYSHEWGLLDYSTNSKSLINTHRLSVSYRINLSN